MSGDLVFYHNPQSRAQMVHWMLHEVGAPFRVVRIDLQKGEQKSPEFLAVNPMGKLPALVHDGTVVTETAAIITYLADAFPQAGLAPSAGDTRRGTYLRWLFFGAGCFEPALLDMMLKRPQVDSKSTIGYGSYEDTLGAFKKMLTPGPYILGGQFSAADVYVGSQIAWALSFKAPGLQEPIFTDYVARITARPAYKKAAIADGRLPADKA
ncbi:glutathione S-transferase family protein [Stigmatella aurantiaca]|uniref:Glutathione S-transferase n=1 Tax=Stigmatella aurantiaca (strain DW4/3-1) TaxID=378806 RepID=Q09E69_STIAD|nr:glutathione S-transferase family protein [Stigmatella aurantiaca]ADO74721.1 Glutathione S-transferase [Stigmatella aurantiaca DW4/3-1]EAU70026.1 glutathione S-transferase [Stigmatella aurantiaca DW4/3-1]